MWQIVLAQKSLEQETVNKFFRFPWLDQEVPGLSLMVRVEALGVDHFLGLDATSEIKNRARLEILYKLMGTNIK
ncbi:hypothetical protein [Pseudomonas mucidolens]|uniref:hypothetical protein n=1 Tax=Pseudomonas mucidolens TaxID=46679 RepID=UPI0010329809|nr:hypothetical protein [Pseudomonas mucidolens]